MQLFEECGKGVGRAGFRGIVFRAYWRRSLCQFAASYDSSISYKTRHP